MKFLADMGVSMSTVEALRALGHDTVHLREQGLKRTKDPDILDKARSEERVLLTFDLDFGELLAAGWHSLPSVVLFRLHDNKPTTTTRHLLGVLNQCAEALSEGVIITVEDHGYRIRRLPILPHLHPPSGSVGEQV